MKLIIKELLAKLILVDLVVKFHVEHIILRTNGLLHVLCILKEERDKNGKSWKKYKPLKNIPENGMLQKQ